MSPTVITLGMTCPAPPLLEPSQCLTASITSKCAQDGALVELDVDHTLELRRPISNPSFSELAMYICESNNLTPLTENHGEPVEHPEAHNLLLQLDMDAQMHYDFDAECDPGCFLFTPDSSLWPIPGLFQFGSSPLRHPSLLFPCPNDSRPSPTDDWDAEDDFHPGDEFMSPSLEQLAQEYGPPAADDSEVDDAQSSELSDQEEPDGSTCDDEESQAEDQAEDQVENCEDTRSTTTATQSVDIAPCGTGNGDAEPDTDSVIFEHTPMVCDNSTNGHIVTFNQSHNIPPPSLGRLPRAAKSRALRAHVLLAACLSENDIGADIALERPRRRRESVKRTSKSRRTLANQPAKNRGTQKGKRLPKKQTYIANCTHSVLEHNTNTSCDVECARKPRKTHTSSCNAWNKDIDTTSQSAVRTV